MSTLALVTGAPGWLGTRLVEALVQGLPERPDLGEDAGERRVRCLVQATLDAAPVRRVSDRVEIVPGDVADAASLARFVEGAGGATVFHAAGVIHPVRTNREWHTTNVLGTRLLLDAARRAKVRRFVYVSSNSPVGVSRDARRLFDEASPYRPYLGYGRSKQQGEELVREAGRSSAMETVIVRPTWFYGPGQPARQSLFFSMIRRGRAPLVGRGDNLRSMAFIDNVCQGLLLAERVEQAKGGTYWVADLRPYPMAEIMDTVERVLEKDFGLSVAHRRIRLPSVTSEVAFVLDGALQRAGLYSQRLHVLSEMNKTIACSVALAQKELGYAPAVALEEGMRRSIAWMLASGTRLG